VPKELKGCLEFIPKMGYVQGNASFSFQMKFTPKKDLLRKCRHHADQDSGTISVPIILNVPDQVLPVKFVFCAQLSSSDLIFDPPLVDFGKCFVSETYMVELRITNCAAVKQKFAFTNLKHGVAIEPDDGFGTILPLETLAVRVVFSPASAVEYSFDLTCKTLCNRVFTVPCHADGCQAPFRLSSSVLRYAPTAVLDTSTQDLILTNTSNMPSTFEFAPPADSDLEICPLVHTVLPGKTVRVQVDFKPKPDKVPTEVTIELPPPAIAPEAELPPPTPVELDPKPASKSGKGKKVAPAKAEPHTAPTPQQPVQPPPPPPPPQTEVITVMKAPSHVEPGTVGFVPSANRSPESIDSIWHRLAVHKVPCFIRTANLPSSSSSYSTQLQFVEVHTVAVMPNLVSESYTLSTELDFGVVPAGDRVVRSFLVRNIGTSTMQMCRDALDVEGVFSVVNALRPVPPNGVFSVTVAFRPKVEYKYIEVLRIRSETNTLTIRLVGQGVSPTLRIEGLTLTSHESGGPLVDVGDTYAGVPLSTTIKLVNDSRFEVRYVLQQANMGHSNYNGVLPFSTSPIEAAIPAGGEQVVKVTFTGDHETEAYSDMFRIVVASQPSPLGFRAVGRCWAMGMFVLGGDLPTHTSDNLLTFPSDTSSKPRHTPQRLKVTFPAQIGASVGLDSSIRTIYIGCVNPPSANDKKGGEFTIEMPANAEREGFSVDVNKGTVEAGSKKAVQFKFSSQAGQVDGQAVGRWVEVTALVILKGGFPPPESVDHGRVPVLLRAYAQKGL